jgi:glutaminase
LGDVSKAVREVQKQGKSSQVIDKLKDIKDKTEFAVWMTAMAGEKISGYRDKIMGRDLSKIYFFV